MAVLCALPLSTASAQSRHNRDRKDCGLNQVVVKGEVSSPAASGSGSFTATISSISVHEVRLSDDHRYLDDPSIAAACASATGATTTSSTATTTCPSATSTAATGNDSTSTSIKGAVINTAGTTKLTLDGATSTVSSLAREDHFVAVFIVPACAGNGSNSGIPATFVAAWSPHSSTSTASTRGDHHDRSGDRHHRGDHHHHGDDHKSAK
jgi:hypothetical protein